MSTAMRDLWPDDIRAQEVFSPEEILQHQAELLETRTSGLLLGHVAKQMGEDRIVLGFEVESARTQSRVRLFEAHHRRDLPYPVAIIPPNDDLPEYLKKPASALIDPGAVSQILLGSRHANHWVAASPDEFSEKIGEVLKMPTLKAVLLSLLSSSDKKQNGASGK